MNPVISRNDDGRYCLSHPVSSAELIGIARNIISESFVRGAKLSSPEETKAFLTLQLALEEREVFGVIFVNRQNEVIAFEKLFYGTIDSAAVHPREVVKRCLALNATAVILAHNHPSGSATPSEADRQITRRISAALALVDGQVLDHIVIGGNTSISFADRGYL